MITSVSYVVLSQLESAVLEIECVWSHYLTAQQKGTSSLSPTQKQEVWVQYTALQVALLVSVCTLPVSVYSVVNSWSVSCKTLD